MLVAALLGMLAGLLMGLLPGIGATTVMLMLLPALAHTDIVFLFSFYFAMLTTSQYFGSVTAIVYGYPGEISSMPAVTHGHAMMRSGQGAQALAWASTASFLATLIGLGYLMLLYHHVDLLSVLFQTKYLVTVFLAVIMVMVMTSTARLLSLIMLLGGLLLGKIGYDSLHMQHILVPQHSLLDAGIPFFPLFAGLVIMPLLIDFCKHRSPPPALDLRPWALPQRMIMLLRLPHVTSMLRGSMIGSVIGLVPGASYMTSSNVAESFERRHDKKDVNGRCLIAAESANNAAAITVLIPLLVFAVPIIPSEAVLLSVAEGMGFGITTSLAFIQAQLPALIGMLLAVALANWILAGYFYVMFARLYAVLSAWIYPGLMIMVMIMMITVAWMDSQLVLSGSVFVLALLVGILVKDHAAKMIMIFGFFLSDAVLDELYRFWIIYF